MCTRTRMTSLQSRLKNSLARSASDDLGEEATRDAVAKILADSPLPVVTTFTTGFSATYRGDMPMSAAFEMTVAEIFGSPSTATVRYVAAAIVFSVVDDEPLDDEIAKILGISYADGEWPGPRYVPAWAGPR